MAFLKVFKRNHFVLDVSFLTIYNDSFKKERKGRGQKEKRTGEKRQKMGKRRWED